MGNKIEIVICFGSSCFSRGNKRIIRLVENFIKEHKIEEKVNFHGTHCMRVCEHGPILKINGEYFTDVDEMNVIEILTTTLLSQ